MAGRSDWTVSRSRSTTGGRSRTLGSSCRRAWRRGWGFRAGLPPGLAPRRDGGEGLAVGLRRGAAASPRGPRRFVDELTARATRAGATGINLFRADSAFWNKKIIARLQRAGWQYSIGVRL